MIDRLADAGEPATLGDWVECLVRPLAVRHRTRHPTTHARFSAADHRPSHRDLVSEESLGSSSVLHIIEGLKRCLRACPEQVRVEQCHDGPSVDRAHVRRTGAGAGRRRADATRAGTRWPPAWSTRSWPDARADSAGRIMKVTVDQSQMRVHRKLCGERAGHRPDEDDGSVRLLIKPLARPCRSRSQGGQSLPSPSDFRPGLAVSPPATPSQGANSRVPNRHRHRHPRLPDGALGELPFAPPPGLMELGRPNLSRVKIWDGGTPG